MAETQHKLSVLLTADRRGFSGEVRGAKDELGQLGEAGQRTAAELDRLGDQRVATQLAESARQAQSLREALDPLARLERQLGDEQDRLNSLHRQGAITDGERARGVAELARRYRELSAAADPATRLANAAIEARQAQAADISQARFNSLLGVGVGAGGSAAASAAVFAEADRLAAEAKALRAELDPLGAAQQNLNAELARYGDLARAGAIPSDELAAATARANRTFEVTAGRIRAAGGAAALTRNQLLTIQYTASDIAASLASGASPFTILMQQGGQVVQAFGSVRGTFAALVTPTVAYGAAALGVVGALAAMATSADAAIGREKELQQALRGRGAAIGVTVDQLRAQSAAEAAAAGISRNAAEDQQRAYLSTGRIALPVMGELIKASRDYAAATGQDATTATAALADAFADPVAGAERLQRQLGLLDDRTLTLIRTLDRQGDRTRAQMVLADALNARVKNLADDGLTWLGRRWNEVATAASNAYRAMGEAIIGREPTPEEQLAAIQAERARRQAQGRAPDLSGVGDPAAQRMRDAELRNRPGAAAPATGGLRAVSDAQLQAMEYDLLRAPVLLERAARAEKDRTASIAAADVVRSLTPDFEQRDEAVGQLGIVNRGIATGRMGDPERARIAQERLDWQTSSRISETDRIRQTAEIEAKAATMTGRARELYRAKALAELDVRGQLLTASERQARIDAAVTTALAGQTAALSDRTAALTADAAATLAVVQAWGEGGAAAAAVAQARRQAIGDVAGTGGSVEARTRQILGQQAAEAAVGGAERADQIAREAKAQEALNAAIGGGLQARRELALQQRIDEQTRDLRIAAANSEGEVQLMLARQIVAVTEALEAKARADWGEEDLQRQRDLLDQIRGPQEEFARRTADLTALWGEGRISLGQYNDALRQLRLEQLQTDKSAGAGLERGLLRIREDYSDTGKQVEDSLRSAAAAGEEAFGNLAESGGRSAKSIADVFRDASLSITASLARAGYRALATEGIDLALGLIKGGAAAATAAYAPGVGPGGTGYTYYGGPRALGGSAEPGGVYRVNEQGDEYWAPERRGRIITASEAREALGGGGGQPPAVSIVVNDNVGAAVRVRKPQRAGEPVSIDIDEMVGGQIGRGGRTDQALAAAGVRTPGQLR